MVNDRKLLIRSEACILLLVLVLVVVVFVDAQISQPLYVLGWSAIDGFIFTVKESYLAAFVMLATTTMALDLFIRWCQVKAQPDTDATDTQGVETTQAGDLAEELVRTAADGETPQQVTKLAETARRDAEFAATSPAAKRVEAGMPITSDRRRGLGALIVGSDGRSSTSKLQAVLWTWSVLYVLLSLIFFGREWGSPTTCAARSACGEYGLTGTQVATLGSGFNHFIEQGLRYEYFALLGLPLGIALAAKALTSSKVVSQDLIKPPVTNNDRGLRAGAAQIVSDDHGQVDLLDTQYLMFNFVTLGVFFTTFMASPLKGLPIIPSTLLALSGVSGAAYTAKKSLETDVKPEIRQVSPARVVLGVDKWLTVVGAGFLPGGGARPNELNAVHLDGRPLIGANWTATRIRVPLMSDPAALENEFRVREGADAAELVVFDSNGVASEPYKVDVSVGTPGQAAQVP